MKLEVKMYVRFKNGKIDKIEKIEENSNYYDIKFSQSKLLDDKENYNITKASHNIIDLIEAGDYVNGELVSDITGEYIRIDDVSHNKQWLQNNIKTILTKEQMENYCYKIGD